MGNTCLVETKQLCSFKGFVQEWLGKCTKRFIFGNITKRVDPSKFAVLLRLNIQLFVADAHATLENLTLFLSLADSLAVCPRADLGLHNTSVLYMNTSPSYKGEELIGT